MQIILLGVSTVFLEEFTDTKETCLFSLVLYEGFTQSYITVYNACLENALEYISQKVEQEDSNIECDSDVKDSHYYWRKKLFNLKKYENKNKKFAIIILKYGKSIVCQMRNPTQPDRPVRKYTQEQCDNFIEMDTGDARAKTTSYQTNDKTMPV